jgi:hypothetical protein
VEEKMELPQKTKQLIVHTLEAVRADPEYNLTADERFAVYKSLGFKRVWSRSFSDLGVSYTSQDYLNYLENELNNLTIGDLVVDWLAIVSARKVLPIWERIWSQVETYNDANPKEIIQTAESILNKSANISEVYVKLSDDFNIPVEVFATFDVALAFRAAYNALELILADPKFINLEIEDKINEIGKDFAFIAMRAYAYNKNTRDEIENKSKGEAITIANFDLKKRLEFWEWWLTEAIPQAWELAERSVSGQK